MVNRLSLAPTSKLLVAMIISMGLLVAPLRPGPAGRIQVRDLEADKRVDVLVDGSLFASYRYGLGFEDKPVFYPVLTASGKMVNRGYPMRDDIPGESRDHPHQQSLFFAYGDVDGTDFWTHQPGRRIVHREVLETSGGTVGVLKLRLEWTVGDHPLLEQFWSVSFHADRQVRWMDHQITLTALGKDVRFGDTKEGMFALRLAEALCEQGGSGHYFNSNGQETSSEAWGQKADWVALRGRLEDELLTVALFDHPKSQGHPTRWHARDYGLFAANPLGTKDFDPSSAALPHVLRAGRSFLFRYRVAIYEGDPGPSRIQRDYLQFSNSR